MPRAATILALGFSWFRTQFLMPGASSFLLLLSLGARSRREPPTTGPQLTHLIRLWPSRLAPHAIREEGDTAIALSQPRVLAQFLSSSHRRAAYQGLLVLRTLISTKILSLDFASRRPVAWVLEQYVWAPNHHPALPFSTPTPLILARHIKPRYSDSKKGGVKATGEVKLYH